MSVKKVKILNTFYNQKHKTVKWLVRDLEKSEDLTFVMLVDDVGPAFGIYSKIPEDVLIDFLEKMKEKEVNWDLRPEITEINTEEFKKDTSLEKIQQGHDVLDQYPYYEILKEIEEETQDEV